MRKNGFGILAALGAAALAIGGCGDASAPTAEAASQAQYVPIDDSHVEHYDAPSTTVTSINLSGKVLFDDARDYGRFGLRKTEAGVSGTHRNLTANPSAANLLGLREATVEILEIDRNFNIDEADCSPEQVVATTTVGEDGSWSVSLPSVIDPCGSDDDGSGKVLLAVKVSLRYCDSNRCFSVRDPSSGVSDLAMTPWYLYHQNAGPTNPKTIGSGTTLNMAKILFEDTAAVRDLACTKWIKGTCQDSIETDIRHEAAMIFSGLVDVTRKFHVQYAWPFQKPDYGEVFVRFPSTVDNSATYGTNLIRIIQGQLKKGWVPLHEYGHVLNARVASFASARLNEGYNRIPCGVNFALSPSDEAYLTGFVLDTVEECDSWSRDGQLEWSTSAFDEGFADFVAHVTLEGLTADEAEVQYRLGCGEAAFDDNAEPESVPSDTISGFGRNLVLGCGELGAGCVDGKSYPTNVARALCDMFDARQDDDDDRVGAGDQLNLSALDIYEMMSGAFYDLGESSVKNHGFDVCDLVTYYVDQPGVDRIQLRGTLRNNGFDCDL